MLKLGPPCYSFQGLFNDLKTFMSSWISVKKRNLKKTRPFLIRLDSAKTKANKLSARSSIYTPWSAS